MAPGITVYKNVFSNPDSIIKGIEDFFADRFALGGVQEKGSSSVYTVNKSTRNVDVFAMRDVDFENYSEEQKNVYLKIKEPMLNCLFDYRSEHGIGGKIIDDCWQVLRYGSEQKFDNHADDGSRYPRLISITAYLNNNYEGGELEYKNFGLSFKPDPGSVLVFPSNYVYQHRVVPVVSGTRYAVVNWFRWATIPKDTTLGDTDGVVY